MKQEMKMINKTRQSLCYKLVKSFRVTGLFTGQFNTEDYGTFANVK